MSLSAQGDDKGSAGASGAPAAAAVPRLRSGGYAAWRPDMDVYLARIGADGAHKRAMEKEHWLQMVQQVHAWQEEATLQALADIGIGSSAASGSAPKTPLTDREQATRKTIRLLVEQSTRAYGAIWSALPDELREQAAKGGEVPQNFAFGLAHWLEQKFQSTESDSIGELLAQWVALQQTAEESFDAYRARVNSLRALLTHAKEPPSDNMYSFMLLDRLQPRYKQAVLALKAGGQLKDASKIAWDTVTAFLNAHERSEQRIGDSAGAESLAMARSPGHRGHSDSSVQAASPGRGSGGDHGDWSRQRGGWRGRGRRGGRGGQSGAEGQDPRTCFRCDQRGHVAAVCPNPPKRPAAASAPGGAPPAQGESVSAVMQSATANPFQSLSSDDDEDGEDEEEWPALPPTPAGQGEHKRTSQSDVAHAIVQDLETALANDAWGWDSMASSHCSGNLSHFISMGPCPKPVPVKVANGQYVHATRMGSVAMRVILDDGRVIRHVLHNVLYHGSFTSNLLCSFIMTHFLGWQFHCVPKDTYAVTPGGGRVTMHTGNRVAVMMCAGREEQGNREAMVHSTVHSSVKPTGADGAVERLVRLHERLNHMGWTRMMATLRSGKVDDLGISVATPDKDTLASAEKRVRECTACVQGRGTRTAFGHRGLDRGKEPADCLHMDTYQVKVEREGRPVTEYGLVVKCLRTAYLWHAQLSSKDQVCDAFLQLVSLVETQFGRVVKRIYADGGTEFIKEPLKRFCANRGKELHWTPPKTPQLNGAAERGVRTFKDYERTMVIHAGAPLRFWARAASHAAFVWNRSHISADTAMTPYEALRGKKPSVRHLGVWGCDVFCHVPRDQRGALDPKAEPGIYLGHSEKQNAAHVLLLSSQKVVCSRDVTFRSDSFRFMQALHRGEDGLREAQVASDEHARAEADQGYDEPPRDSASPEPAHPLADAAADADSDGPAQEYVVDSIVGQRKKNGRTEYKVRWSSFDADEDSWEPAAELKENAALDAWLAAQPPARRSERRHASSATAVVGRPTQPTAVPSADSPSSDAAEIDAPQVHMAMSALRAVQLPEERPQHELLQSAVVAGVGMLEQNTPRTYREAMASPDGPRWKAALDKEMRSCAEQQVWTLVRRDQLPRGANVLPCKEVFKLKVDEHGQVIEHKARFTPKGFRQKYGVDFTETFARTGAYKTLRVALSLVAKWDHELAQFDVPTAFLNATVDEDIYMELPEGYEQPGMVCKLQKALYGLKQAPRNWDKLVHAFLTGDMGFRATVSDPSLYFRRSRSGRLMLIYRFVDDMQGSFHADDAAEFGQSVRLLQDRFRIKQMQTATWMLGMRIQRDRKAKTITLSQELYVTKALEKFGLKECRVVSAPEAVGAAHDDSQPALQQPADAQRYMEIVGTLMYAAISTRPDIAHAVHYLASNMQAPTGKHIGAAERVLRYLAGTREVGLVFGSRNGALVGDSRGRRAQVQVDVCAFADADWANDKGDRRSISGWVAKINGDPVSWSSKKQRVVALSTCEAELYAESAAIQEVLWLRGLMEELGLHTQTGSTVFGDNQAAIAVSQNGIKGERTKHVDVKYHFVTETVERGEVKLRWVPTAQQQADIFTKALSAPVFLLLRQQLMTC
jgi:transposase InsO family protein